jgi:DNA-binding LytR/AlgR family response regulator
VETRQDVTEAPTRPADRPGRDVWRAAPRVVLACLIVSLALSATGAIRSNQAALILVFESVTGALFGLVAARWLTPVSWYGQRAWAAALTIAAWVTLPMTGIVLALLVLREHVALTLGVVRQVAPQVFSVSLLMTALAFLVRRPPTQTHAAPKDAPAPKLFQRLPAKLRGAELYAVEAEDHYLRLHTSLGQDLILMRLSDAIAELEGIEGAQTHRSWWVAKDAVTDVERLEGRAMLTLKDGAQAPVSRGFAKTLRAAGWL